MEIGMIGLGRMGMNMARRLLQAGHKVAAYNRSPEKTKELATEGGRASFSIEELVNSLSSPKIIWLMLPAGQTTEDHIAEVMPLLNEGDILVEGGNSYYKDDIRHAKTLAEKNIHYVDAGVSGGIWGLKVGYCTMIGGEKAIFDYIEPIIKDLAPPDGYMYCGPSGAGHFVKMVHNGIEYGMMQAYAEGFSIIDHSPYGKELNYSALSHLWNQGSVIRSWLLELLEPAFAKDPDLTSIKGVVDDSGEGRWTVQQAIETGVSAPVIAASVFRRFESREKDAFENRVLAAMRREFGGHAVVDSDK